MINVNYHEYKELKKYCYLISDEHRVKLISGSSKYVFTVKKKNYAVGTYPLIFNILSRHTIVN